VTSYAVTLTSRPSTIDGILLMIDDRTEAEEIAAELRRNGHPVAVRELPADQPLSALLRDRPSM
jgi:hypothetical protein